MERVTHAYGYHSKTTNVEKDMDGKKNIFERNGSISRYNQWIPKDSVFNDFFFFFWLRMWLVTCKVDLFEASSDRKTEKKQPCTSTYFFLRLFFS